MRSPLKARGRAYDLGARGTRIAHVVRVVRYAAGPGAIMEIALAAVHLLFVVRQSLSKRGELWFRLGTVK